MDWTKNYFDDFYLKYFLQTQPEDITNRQIDFIRKFFNCGSYILDAGCGIGRHSIKLGGLGFKVLGIDSSPLFIKTANNSLKEQELQDVSFLIQDLRELSFENEFDGIINMWSSFGYFDDETNFDILKRFYRALKRNGKLIIDVENRDYILKYFVRETFRDKGEFFILERRKFNPLKSVVFTHRFIVGPNIRKDYYRYIRIYTVTELINLFKAAGFSSYEVFGSYNMDKFTENSKRIIIIGLKA